MAKADINQEVEGRHRARGSMPKALSLGVGCRSPEQTYRVLYEGLDPGPAGTQPAQS